MRHTPSWPRCLVSVAAMVTAGTRPRSPDGALSWPDRWGIYQRRLYPLECHIHVVPSESEPKTEANNGTPEASGTLGPLASTPPAKASRKGPAQGPGARPHASAPHPRGPYANANRRASTPFTCSLSWAGDHPAPFAHRPGAPRCATPHGRRGRPSSLASRWRRNTSGSRAGERHGEARRHPA